MTLSEINLMVLHNSENAPGNYAGKLTKRSVTELTEWLTELEEKDAHDAA